MADVNEKEIFDYEFDPPVEYDGKKYAKLHFDFTKLRGKDSMAIEDEIRSMGKAVLVPALDSAYLVRFLAKACDEPIGYDLIEGLEIRDFNKLVRSAKDFLLA